MEQLDAMPARHMMLYQALYALEPFGPVRDNLHAARIAELIFNSSRGKSQAPANLMDFMLEDPEEARERKTKQAFHRLVAVAKPKDA